MDNNIKLNEQTSLYDRGSVVSSWSDRVTDWDPVARLGDTFLLNSQVGDHPMPHTRLVPPDVLEQVSSRLALTLHGRLENLKLQEWALRSVLTDDEVVELLGINIADLPQPYKEWRFSIEIYALVRDTIFLLLNGQFVRYRRLSRDELRIVLSERTAPFTSFSDEASGIMIAVVAVPGRLGALGGLRGERRSLIAAGEAIAQFRKLWLKSGVEDKWSWELEFFDDACSQVLGIDGVERMSVALAYRKDGKEEKE
ncbi:hypothetical protein KJY78_06295 [Canibacter sp. lx-45]|uniref:hypothetical protein n=1 Tax=Canibacter zhuwentaonis TaxID=2837491 RepID=UPI001BDBE6E9|nr:hypothetical protein [Canibacter zhuwentaonis]MBT1035953.1 hypothetical protein [Canibacter zhuwentaonis]